MKKYKFIEEGPERYPWTNQEIRKVLSFPSSNKNLSIGDMSKEIWEMLFKNPIHESIDEFAISGDNIILFFQGTEVDRMHLYQLIKWALDVDPRWTCHWIDI